jgi:hypothetical protein
MTATKILLMGMMVALVAVAVQFVPRTANADDVGYIERLIPAESMEVETGGGEVYYTEMEPFVRGNDPGFIERLLPAESMEVETGGGDTPVVWSEEPLRGNDPGYIERLLPAESTP